MDRRGFLKSLGVAFAAAGVPLVALPMVPEIQEPRLCTGMDELHSLAIVSQSSACLWHAYPGTGIVGPVEWVIERDRRLLLSRPDGTVILSLVIGSFEPIKQLMLYGKVNGKHTHFFKEIS